VNGDKKNQDGVVLANHPRVRLQTLQTDSSTGISSRMLQSIELRERRLSEDVVDAVYLFTEGTPESLRKGIPQSSLGGAFDFEKYQHWQMVRQDENEEGPKRFMKERVEALKWIGKAMEKPKGGFFGRRSSGDS
jgi:hypothetical protein